MNSVENRRNDIEELIGKVLAGEATAEEKTQLENWMGTSEENAKYFNTLKNIFEQAAQSEVKIQFDTDAAWNKVKEKIRHEEVKSIPLYRQEIWFTPLRIAAGIIFIIVGSYLVYEWTSPPIQELVISTAITTAQDTLPDGSTAFLNKGSELKFEYNPRKKERKVKLKGEAYFSVKHEDESPFVIEAEDVLVRDIGTEFNLKAYPGKDTIEIIVTEGEVQFYTKENPGLNLKAGEKAVYSKKAKEFYRIEKPDTNALAYKTKVFSFNNTELRNVISLLNEVYNSKITLNNEAIQSCRLTANFKEDNAEIIAEVIAETMGLTLTRKDGQLILDGAGCIQ